MCGEEVEGASLAPSPVRLDEMECGLGSLCHVLWQAVAVFTGGAAVTSPTTDWQASFGAWLAPLLARLGRFEQRR